MVVAIHQPQYLPWLGYLDKIDRADVFVVLDNVQFKKNEWQNRNRIRTAQGWQWVTVPVLHRFGQKINEVRVNSGEDWAAKHVRTIEMHYARAPHREPLMDGLRAIYRQPWERLSDLNVAVLRWLLTAYGITTPMRIASEMSLREEPTDRLIDICRAVGGDRYLAGAGAAGYMDRPRFEASGIGLEVQDFHHPVYRQCYEPFMPGMAAIDLLFACGGEALQRLRATRQEGRALAAAQGNSAEHTVPGQSETEPGVL
ncbi:MAG: WbqC family protein [Nitrospirota bacterium]|nr:WbqC family protein [Nitrospirota bacterium]MDE3241312.1 WbqC family protein [Nitrospirota bacterium]